MNEKKSHKERNKGTNQHLLFLLSFLPLVFWFCWALWLFSCVFRTADSNRSLIQVVIIKVVEWLYPHHQLLTATHFLLLQPLPALILHGSTPPLLFQPVLQELLLPLHQLLFVVLPGPLLPLQAVLLPIGCGEMTSLGRASG